MNFGASAPASGHLPLQLTSLIGREAELEELTALMSHERLLTLIGPGGAGKTRLAAELGERATTDLLGGAWWVDLADVDDSELVGERIVTSLAARDLPASAPLEAIALRLRGAPTVLILDNCEQVAGACAELASALLRTCPELTVVATSRQALAVPGEQVFRVAGLPVRDGEHDAVELFLSRARRHDPGLRADAPNLAAIASICQRLDGMPLAIELAAARTPLLGPQDIAERLANDSGLLRRDAHGVPARQRSMEAALDWSHRLLTAAEKMVLRRLAVFRGTFDLEAAEAVAAMGAVERGDVLDALGGLVAQSLVEVSREEGTRYGLLAVVRIYAERQLNASGEASAALERHAAHYLALIDAAMAGLAGPEQLQWLDRLDAEHDNLRAALASRLAAAPETAGRLAGGLWRFWYRRGHYHEARRWLEEVVEATAGMTPTTRAGVLTGAGVFAFLQCEYVLAEARLEEALAIHRERGDERGIARALHRLGSIAREQGRYERARELHEQSLAIWERLADEEGVAVSLDYLGFVAWLAGDFGSAAELSDRAAGIFLEMGELQSAAAAMVNVGAAAHYGGNATRAASLLDEALDLAVRSGYQEGIAWALHVRGSVAARARDLPRAAEMLIESLRLHRGLGDRWRIASVVESIAGELLARVEPARAATLMAAAEASRGRLGAPVPIAERPDLDRSLRTVRRALAAGEMQTAQERGRAMTLDEAATEASVAARRLFASDVAPRTHLEDLLTERELAVLRLLGDGRTNREIGAALFISPSTAGVHVSNILRKLSVKRRTQAATRAFELGLLADQPATGDTDSTGSSRELHASIPPTIE